MEILPSLMRGLLVTVQLFAFSFVLSFLIAFLCGLGRLSKYKVIQKPTAVFVEFIRGTSMLVQLFWLYFALPVLFDVSLPAMVAGVAALAMNYGAYASEIVRSSVLAVPRGQYEASIALNLTPFQRMRRIILPQAFRIMLPGFGNISIELLKGTSLVSLITIADLTFQGNVLINYMGKQTEVFTALLVIYFLLALPLILITRWLERKMASGGS
jgi:polar amino acid transport system permease protein